VAGGFRGEGDNSFRGEVLVSEEKAEVSEEKTVGSFRGDTLVSEERQNSKIFYEVRSRAQESCIEFG